MIYDTRRKKKVVFEPIKPSNVSMYVCGVTVYDLCHLGHARCYVAFDVVHRWLEASGYDVNYIQNFTDIDDKIIIRANEKGIDFLDLVDENIEAYYEDMDSLNILRADVYPRCTEYVEKMISITEDLISKNNAYVADDGVYFHVESAPEKYGLLTGQNIDAVLGGAGGRVLATGGGKRDHKDFALWKLAKPGEPSWESPWGKGRPGWHIECSAMSIKYLGNSIDIHGGGLDLIFPHHENEIVQSESFTGEIPFSKIWVHNGLLRMGSDKMSKSVGNIVLIRDVLDKFSTNAIRMFILSSHYRSPLEYNEDQIKSKEISIKKLTKLLENTGGKVDFDQISYVCQIRQEQFINAMDDDLNTPRAIATIFDLHKDLTRLSSEGIDIAAGQDLLNRLSDILGLDLKNKNIEYNQDEFLEPLMKILTNIRSELRNKKEFELADKIRFDLYNIGINLEDSLEGTNWNIIDN